MAIRRMLVNDPLRAQQFKTQRPDSPEDLYQPLYDRAQVNVAATAIPSQVAFFTIPKGQSATLITGTASAARTKDYRDTNLEQAGVSPTKMYKIQGIAVALFHTSQAATSATDRGLVMENGYLHFRVVDKDLLYLPLVFLPITNPIISQSTTANNTTMFSAPGGGGQGIGMFRLPIEVTLNPYENFSLTWNYSGTTTPTGATDAQISLMSYMRRPT